jgi:hypothetical protein
VMGCSRFADFRRRAVGVDCELLMPGIARIRLSAGRGTARRRITTPDRRVQLSREAR